MPQIAPTSAEDLAEALKDVASKHQTVMLLGNNSKRLMSGPLLDADVVISTAGLRRVLQYEPNDLTISVESGMPFAELQSFLAKRGQMIALDPPFYSQATVGGVVATNSSGPMRRSFGTARDLVIGMTFAMLDGKLIKTGGMVVKNVAGLDMGKLLIGSFGTLAAITSVNFRLHPVPCETRTFLFSFQELDGAIEKRNAVVRSVLQPLAVDLITPPAAARLGMRGYLVLVRASGSRAVLERYTRDLSGAETLSRDQEASLWQQIREFSPDFLKRHPGGVVLRVSTTLTDVAQVLRLVSGAAICRAASGVTYVCATSWQGISVLWRVAGERGWGAAVEYASDEIRATKELWLLKTCPGSSEAFAMMKRVKELFDPENLLNRSRLYGRI
ncbi:MAG: FAD-binding oxidoreductase [Acidobacteriaceae bacterium]|nr:FAD-binding oxidoreductase [Acidobacteriaceae bacterium]MBV9767199.1 FAD-binding oxidoreductase [Acidobacteriaceae bacterium]